MKDIKFVSGFAVFGFVLSFVSSLFSPHSTFIHKLLMALLFAVVFAAIGFGIKLVYNKFLSDSDGDFSSDFTPNPQMNGAQSAPQKGQLVDIVIQDEDISPGESPNRFVVGDNHQMLNDTDITSSAPAASESVARQKVEASPVIDVPNVTQMSTPDEPDDVPVVNAESSSFVPMSAAALTQSGPSLMNTSELSEDSEKIDTLPDMNNFSFGSSDSSSEKDDDSDGYADDSDFEPSFTSRGSSDVPEVKDAGLIAKAISSVLADEKSI
jgi:hypothetical protein